MEQAETELCELSIFVLPELGAHTVFSLYKGFHSRASRSMKLFQKDCSEWLEYKFLSYFDSVNI